VRFGDVADAVTARALGGARIFTDRSALAATGPGSFRVGDLIGYEVRDARLGGLGEVTGVLRYPSCDMLVVGEAGTLVPMLSAYGFTVSEPERTIAVRLPPGFEEL
jgi:ribosomal 30S subunit maturation factor RimM